MIYNFVEKIKPNSFAINSLKGKQRHLSSNEQLNLYKLNHIFMKKTNIKEFTTYNLDLIKLGKIPKMCALNGLCNNFINLDSFGNLYKTCVFKNNDNFIGNIDDIDILEKFDNKTKLKLDLKSSIYFKSGKKENLKYLLGNGCNKFRQEDNLNNYINGIIKYIDD